MRCVYLIFLLLFFPIISCEVMGATIQHQLVKLLNETRVQHGLQTLCFDDRLKNAALIHSREMQRMKRLTHDTADGSTLGSRAASLGIQWRTLGENISFGITSPQDVFQAWMESPGHRRNMLDATFNACGSATAGEYWSLEFAESLDEFCQKNANIPASKTLHMPNRTQTKTVTVLVHSPNTQKEKEKIILLGAQNTIQE